MMRTDTDRREAEAARIFAELADSMQHVAIRMPALIGHMDNCDAHATELLGAADCVRQWGERLK
jgi:hypothetical protein